MEQMHERIPVQYCFSLFQITRNKVKLESAIVVAIFGKNKLGLALLKPVHTQVIIKNEMSDTEWSIVFDRTAFRYISCSLNHPQTAGCIYFLFEFQNWYIVFIQFHNQSGV